MSIRSIKGVITLTDGSTSEFLITDEGGWNQWNAEGWGDAKARLGETGPLLDAMVQGLMEYPDAFTPDEDDD